MKINLTLNPTPSRFWQKSAMKKAREAAASAGVEWADADVVVVLPERGRYFVKSPGFTQLCAVG